jgi:hypothetical protein
LCGAKSEDSEPLLTAEAFLEATRIDWQVDEAYPESESEQEVLPGVELSNLNA